MLTALIFGTLQYRALGRLCVGDEIGKERYRRDRAEVAFSF